MKWPGNWWIANLSSTPQSALPNPASVFRRPITGPTFGLRADHHISRRLAWTALTSWCRSLHRARCLECASSRERSSAVRCDVRIRVTCDTNILVHPNIFASVLAEYLAGSLERSSCIFWISSSLTCFSSGDFSLRNSGGREPVIGDAGLPRRRGDEGAAVVDSGASTEGGGRWTKTMLSSSSCVTVAFGLLSNGSRCFRGGRSAVPGRGLGYLPAYARTKEGMGAILRGMDSIVQGRASEQRVRAQIVTRFPRLLKSPLPFRKIPTRASFRRQFAQLDRSCWYLDYRLPDLQVSPPGLPLKVRSGIPGSWRRAGTGPATALPATGMALFSKIIRFR